MIPKEFKEDHRFIEGFTHEINEKFFKHEIFLKINIDKTERKSSLALVSGGAEIPKYDEEGKRCDYHRVENWAWALYYDWDEMKLDDVFNELNLLFAKREFHNLDDTVYKLRKGDLCFQQIDSSRLEQCLDTIFELEKFLPGEYISKLLMAAKFNENSQNKVNRFIQNSGYYYQALLLNTCKEDKCFSNLLRTVTSNLNNSKQLKLFEERLKLFEIPVSSYKTIFAERIFEKDFILLSKEAKDEFLISYTASEEATLPLDLLISKGNEDEFKTEFCQVVNDSEPIPVFSVDIDKVNGDLSLDLLNRNFNLKINGVKLEFNSEKLQSHEVKVGDFISFDNNGSADLCYLGRSDRDVALTLISRAKDHLYDLFLEGCSEFDQSIEDLELFVANFELKELIKSFRTNKIF
ncbi:MAG: hypothetical protein MK033_02265 [Candidatus Caenarcaniphilales bacterium]|nr:hypothetical protein [Candidatus Caenarcaniphilales bacterium]